MPQITIDDDTMELLNKIKTYMERGTPVGQTYDNAVYRAVRFFVDDHGL